MRRLLLGVLLATLLVSVPGCARGLKIMGHGVSRSTQAFGDVGITGNDCDLTLVRGSRVIKLSVIGDNNNITVEEGAVVNKVEFWGHGNVVSIPEYLRLRSDEMGTNQIIRRPRERRVTGDWPPPVATPDEYTATSPRRPVSEPEPEADQAWQPAPAQPTAPPPVTEPVYEHEEEEPEFRPPPQHEPATPPPLEK